MKSIIVVDDQEDMRTLIKKILTRKGYEVHEDATGDIIDNEVTRRSDLVLLDINLEKNDGRDLCQKLKQSASTEQIPVILISALPELAGTFHICGADDYLKKPFSSDELVSKVEHFIHAA